MKKIIFSTILYFLFIPIFATSKDTSNVVTMVSYEQGPHDLEGSLSLKNNTDETIHNISFIITYYDMSGTQLDYNEFRESVDIAPGMTKRIDIPAYEFGKSYRYYKTKDKYGISDKTFKIQFELKDYNTSTSRYEEIDDDDEMNPPAANGSASLGVTIMVVLCVLFVIGFVIGIYALVYKMAQRRHRDPALWLILSFLVSPIFIILILFIVGDNED